MAGPGAARHGTARLGQAGHGEVRRGWAGLGTARRGMAGLGAAWRGMARLGKARQGKAFLGRYMLKKSKQEIAAAATPRLFLAPAWGGKAGCQHAGGCLHISAPQQVKHGQVPSAHGQSLSQQMQNPHVSHLKWSPLAGRSFESFAFFAALIIISSRPVGQVAGPGSRPAVIPAQK